MSATAYRARRRVIRWFAARRGVCRCSQCEFCAVCSQRMRELSHDLPATWMWCRTHRTVYRINEGCPNDGGAS